MKEHVLEINREVEDDDRAHHRDPGWQRDHIEQAKATRFGEDCKAYSGGWKDDADQRRVYGYDAEIVRPAPAPPNALFPPRRDEFPNRHEDEDAAERGEADEGLVGEENLTHRLDQRSEEIIIQSFT